MDRSSRNSDHLEPSKQRSSRRSASSGSAGAGASARAGSSPRARTCWRPPTPPVGAGGALLRAAGSGLAGVEVEAEALASGVRARVRARARSRCTRSGGRRPRGAAVRLPARRRTIRATSARSCGRAQAFGASCVALGPGTRRSVQPEGRAGEHGGGVRGAAREGRGRRARCRGRRSRSRPARRSRCPNCGEIGTLSVTGARISSPPVT